MDKEEHLLQSFVIGAYSVSVVDEIELYELLAELLQDRLLVLGRGHVCGRCWT